MGFTCPVCGFPDLKEPPRSARTGAGSYEICPSCSFQFGVTDDDRGLGYEEWRNQWIARGMPWDSGTSSPPAGWSPEAQLKALGLEVVVSEPDCSVSKEPLAFVCSHVFQKVRPVLLVSRVEEGWQLLCGGAHEDGEVPHVVGLNHLLDGDPSLRTILDLPPEWEAERPDQGAGWERRPITR